MIQSIAETGNFNTPKSVFYNTNKTNLFGMLAVSRNSRWTISTYCNTHGCFAIYPSIEESIEDRIHWDTTRKKPLNKTKTLDEAIQLLGEFKYYHPVIDKGYPELLKRVLQSNVNLINPILDKFYKKPNNNNNEILAIVAALLFFK